MYLAEWGYVWHDASSEGRKAGAGKGALFYCIILLPNWSLHGQWKALHLPVLYWLICLNRVALIDHRRPNAKRRRCIMQLGIPEQNYLGVTHSIYMQRLMRTFCWFLGWGVSFNASYHKLPSWPTFLASFAPLIITTPTRRVQRSKEVRAVLQRKH